jgi:hypothetical protein
MKKIRTQAFIPFPAQDVWKVLADFEAYSEWNPLTIRARGEARLGARAAMAFIHPARPGRVIEQTVTITSCTPGKKLAWVGAVPLIFRGHHFFDLEPEGGGTQLTHGEDVSGLVTWTFTAEVLQQSFVPAYQRMNEALEKRVAALAA